MSRSMGMVKLLLASMASWTGEVGLRANCLAFEDDFDDDNAAGWEEIDGTFEVNQGIYVVQSSGFCNDARAVAGESDWVDYTLDVDFNFASGHAAVLFRVESIAPGCDAGRYYQFHVFPDFAGFCQMNFSGGNCSRLGDASYSVTTGEWHHLRLVVEGAVATALIDDDQVISLEVFGDYPAGRIGLKRINGGQSLYDNVAVTVDAGSGSEGCGQLPGDCNQDSALDISDAVCVFRTLFTGEPVRFPCGDGTSGDTGNRSLLDWDQDGEPVNVSDGIALLQYYFRGGPAHRLSVVGAEDSGCVPMPGCPPGCGGGE